MLPLLLSVTLAASCRIEDAGYALRTEPRITASFHDVESGPDWPARLALQVHVGTTGRNYWFLPWDGGTSGLQHVASTTDVRASNWRPPSPDGGPRPLGDLDYVATDPAYNMIDATPRRNGVAPAHILLLQLGDALWHLTPNDQRDSAPRQFFDLVSCSKPQ